MKNKQCKQTGCKNTPGKNFIETEYCGIHAPKETLINTEPIQMEKSSLGAWEEKTNFLSSELIQLKEKLSVLEQSLLDHEEIGEKLVRNRLEVEESTGSYSTWLSERSSLENQCNETQGLIVQKEHEVLELNGKVKAGIPINHTTLILSSEMKFISGDDLRVLKNGKYNVWLKVFENEQVFYIQADTIKDEYIHSLDGEGSVLYAQDRPVLSITLETRGMSNKIEPQIVILDGKGKPSNTRVETYNFISR